MGGGGARGGRREGGGEGKLNTSGAHLSPPRDGFGAHRKTIFNILSFPHGRPEGALRVIAP